MNELIDVLRKCADPYASCTDCKYSKNDMCDDLLRDAADAIERLVADREKMRDQLILNICSHCDSHIKYCGECPIIKDINEVFNEQ